MDLIRAFTEVTFSRVARRWLRKNLNFSDLSEQSFFPLDLNTFLDEARIYHPQLSDNSLSLIYKLGYDEWCRFGYEALCSDEINIFQSLAFLTNQILEERNDVPVVHFKDLFRWREITQLLGEDLLTCSFLAFKDVSLPSSQRSSFSWPSVIHNDNTNLNYLFRKNGLCELHSHLKASSNTFEITWVCLMNHISGLHKHFEYIADKHEPSIKEELGASIYDYVEKATRLRWTIYQFLKSDQTNLDLERINDTPDSDSVDAKTEAERLSLDDNWIPDYIISDNNSPMAVYAGERKFLYLAFLDIFKFNDPILTLLLYEYILTKSLLRSYFIQINNNIGFSNFKRFQDVKNALLTRNYNELIESLPLWEAKYQNFTQVFETRIAPLKKKKNFIRQILRINKFNSDKGEINEMDTRDILNYQDWLVIFHFLKRGENDSSSRLRNFKARKDSKKAVILLSDMSKLKPDSGIDAASSEFAARPEVYAQAFRFLRHYGFNATFHAGEDFYDLADGLRAIDEAITLLDMCSSDRIGHALALGMNAADYYAERHNVAALPKQWMLDNVVWLFMKSKEFGISADTETDWFLIDTYKRLVNEIGYRRNDEDIPDISDYWEAMALRGDDPNWYLSSSETSCTGSEDADSWDFYSLLRSDRLDRIRKFNRKARQLYIDYHTNSEIKSKGNLVRVFELPTRYNEFITQMQDAMIKFICKRQICIECCPSSNVRIGRLKRFDAHPIIRFMPVDPNETRYQLNVTVNTDDLGVFSTSLPNEYSLLALALMKMHKEDGSHRFSTQEVYDWIERLIHNSHKFTFLNHPFNYSVPSTP